MNESQKGDGRFGGSERLELANRLFREYYYMCFWHLKPGLVVTEELIPVIVKGLRDHGNRRAMFAAARLLEMKDAPAHAANAVSEGSPAPPGQPS